MFLKPCPCCDETEWRIMNWGEYWEVRCGDCLMSAPRAPWMGQAIANWNAAVFAGWRESS